MPSSQSDWDAKHSARRAKRHLPSRQVLSANSCRCCRPAPLWILLAAREGTRCFLLREASM